MYFIFCHSPGSVFGSVLLLVPQQRLLLLTVTTLFILYLWHLLVKQSFALSKCFTTCLESYFMPEIFLGAMR